MKRFAFVLAGCTALAAVACFGLRGGAQEVKPASATSSSKIGVINLALVLKKFNQANYLGDQLLEEAQKEETRLKSERAALQKKEAELQLIPEMAKREEEAKKLRLQQSALQEQEIEARKKFADRQANMAKDVYQKFNAVVDTVAKTYNLELVLTYPDATSKEESESPAQAFRMLSAPAVMVAWKHPSLDITETVIKYLNHNFRAPEGYTPGTKTPNLTPMK